MVQPHVSCGYCRTAYGDLSAGDPIDFFCESHSDLIQNLFTHDGKELDAGLPVPAIERGRGTVTFHASSIAGGNLPAQVFLVVILSLLLLIMGVRVPDLSQGNAPKPRPRAVVAVQDTGHESVGTHAVIAADTVPWHSGMVRRTCTVCRLRGQNTRRPLPVFSDHDVARGPPPAEPYRMAT